ncbi:MAG: 6,7-dimethyl-8-ribityllumazine synthase [Candidatus Deianiraeaceae bacterium]|jgi:6,7-dimethyl-8-ribityllumazine synthase
MTEKTPIKIAIVSSSFNGFLEQSLVQNSITSCFHDEGIEDFQVNKENDINHNITQSFKKQTAIEDISKDFHGYLSACIQNDKYQISLVIVTGALEIPQAINWLAQTNKYDGLLALGCVIKGETTHFEHVCNEVMHGISKLALKTGIPIANSVVTALNKDDAIARVIAKGKNLGSKGMSTLLKMIDLKGQIDSLK